MEFFKELLILESVTSSKKEQAHVTEIVNKMYTEWKKIGRRRNAVDLITTTTNKLSTIDPSIVNMLHGATKVKIATLLVRCFDIPYWKDVEDREKAYKKLIKLIKALEWIKPNSDTDGITRDIIATRMSASITHKSKNKNIFVSYEPKTTSTYLRYLFGNEIPKHVYKMQMLSLPDDFDVFIRELTANYNKALKKFNDEQTK